MPDMKEYPMIEVARHSTADSCWLVIDGKVYDTTDFLLEHPGGDDIVVESSGRDATREFEDVGHSGEARAQLEDLLIGTLRDPTPEETERAEDEARKSGEKPAAADAGSAMLKTIAGWVLPIVLVGLAYLLRKYAK
ncbi:unnamed protein product [Chondrus crispus]|uniref:Cytochrome b5 heme-binding domain-containing protein n=1 Tax=Chondrus crispus TaxID=2769 RepID=R7QCY4_CHOCR|nr:unnamed protein product [Chondrus crispus]CDF35315.1 unnamed protein product [Chondrus crispus]|eukprot:XP_005715134.1 unnamed protein product [Chondrus crispus]